MTSKGSRLLHKQAHLEDFMPLLIVGTQRCCHSLGLGHTAGTTTTTTPSCNTCTFYMCLMLIAMAVFYSDMYWPYFITMKIYTENLRRPKMEGHTSELHGQNINSAKRLYEKLLFLTPTVSTVLNTWYMLYKMY